MRVQQHLLKALCPRTYSVPAHLSVLYFEGLKVDPIMLDNIIENAHGDMRQVLNNLYLWSRGDKDLKSRKDDVKRDSSNSMKDIKGGAFDVTGLFFRAAPRKPDRRSCGYHSSMWWNAPLISFIAYVRCHRAAHSRLGGRLFR